MGDQVQSMARTRLCSRVRSLRSGSRVLPKYDTGTVWEAGSIVETMASFRADHGGGYQYRLCPLESNLTEACFQETPMAFAGNSKLMIWNGTIIELNSVDVSEGTL